MRFYLLLGLVVHICSTIHAYPKLTLDEYLSVSNYPFSALSPNGQYMLVISQRASWNSSKYEYRLWLHDTSKPNEKKSITDQLTLAVRPQWSPSGNWFVFMNDKNQKKVTEKKENVEPYQLEFFNVKTKQHVSIAIGKEVPSGLIWSHRDSTLYFSTIPSKSTDEDPVWKDTIRYRSTVSDEQTKLYRLDIRERRGELSSETVHIRTVDFLIGELTYSNPEKKLIFSTVSSIIDDTKAVELYALNLNNVSSLTRLTKNEGVERGVTISLDGRYVFYQVVPISAKNEERRIHQTRLYSMNLATGSAQRWAADFDGDIHGYAFRSEGGIYILGQKGVNVQIYAQQSPTSPTIQRSTSKGTYHLISTSTSTRYSSIAFVFSSFEEPKEAYFVRSANDLTNPIRLTTDNQYFKQRDLPRATTYQWTNKDDHKTIEGILHYPPGCWQKKNLPLLVLIHGGPASASLNSLEGSWYTWATLAASEGWLVLEPNYRGSTGYGDAFTDSVRFETLTVPGNDILDGVDQLIADGIADGSKLAVGGYSYGGYLTNWLITRTTRFNAALSGAGAVEQIANWGLMDIPVFMTELLGGNPWDIPQRYFNESALFQLDKVTTPTHIITGSEDIRVPISQSLILERGLHALGIPSQLLLFPGEDHSMSSNPEHAKIKLREELKWLEKYGHTRFVKTTE